MTTVKLADVHMIGRRHYYDFIIDGQRYRVADRDGDGKIDITDPNKDAKDKVDGFTKIDAEDNVLAWSNSDSMSRVYNRFRERIQGAITEFIEGLPEEAERAAAPSKTLSFSKATRDKIELNYEIKGGDDNWAFDHNDDDKADTAVFKTSKGVNVVAEADSTDIAAFASRIGVIEYLLPFDLKI